MMKHIEQEINTITKVYFNYATLLDSTTLFNMSSIDI